MDRVGAAASADVEPNGRGDNGSGGGHGWARADGRITKKCRAPSPASSSSSAALPRVVPAHDASGREMGQVLWEGVSGRPNVRVHAHARAVAAILEQGRCVGVRFLEDTGRIASARARCTLLATGGAGQVYRETTNPP